ncbi:MAG: hypothetical protein ACYC2G_00390, partial [Gemmatimonadaceae bacterium]
TVSLGPAARRRPALLAPSEHGPMLRVPGYLQHDPTDRCAGRIIGLPVRADVPIIVRESLIVEHYAR